MEANTDKPQQNNAQAQQSKSFNFNTSNQGHMGQRTIGNLWLRQPRGRVCHRQDEWYHGLLLPMRRLSICSRKVGHFLS